MQLESWVNFDYQQIGSVKKRNGQNHDPIRALGDRFPSANYTTTTICSAQHFSELIRMETNYSNYFIYLFLFF